MWDVFGPCCIHILVSYHTRVHLEANQDPLKSSLVWCASRFGWQCSNEQYQESSRVHFNQTKPAKCEHTIRVWNITWKKKLRYIHLIFPVSVGFPICKFNGSGFWCHSLPAIFSCTKRLVLLLDIANWCVLSDYFNVLSYSSSQSLWLRSQIRVFFKQ